MSSLSQYGLPLPPSNRRIASTSSKLSQYQRGQRRRVTDQRDAAQRQAQPVPPTGAPKPPEEPPPLRKSLGARDAMDVIVACARDHKVVQISYTKKSGESGLWQIEPYALKTRGTPEGTVEPYLYAYCLRHPAVPIHSFRVSSIDSAEETLETFTPRFPVEL